jgi:uncharacterized protein (DUF1684 family)
MYRQPVVLAGSLRCTLLAGLLAALTAPAIAASPAPGGAAPSAAPGTAAAAAAPDAAAPAAVNPDEERSRIDEWRARRVSTLTADDGWLTLAGLFWLSDGPNTFGRSPSSMLRLDNPALALESGYFLLRQHKVRFIAKPGSGVTHAGQPVTVLDLTSDAAGEPTVLESGPLRFFVIERAGNLGVRVRDLNNPHRANFRGLDYFPVSTDWVLDARFEPYEPPRRLRIINILGMEQEELSPGAVVFTKDGHEWRLDTVLEQPGDRELFIMFADTTSGHETYGAGRFLYIPLPAGGRARLDFNQAYNPPCALNDFATCPLPPRQNRLRLRVDAGEKTYAGGPQHEGVSAPATSARAELRGYGP